MADKKTKVQYDRLDLQHRLAMHSLEAYDTFLENLSSATHVPPNEHTEGSVEFSDFEDYADLAVQKFLEIDGAPFRKLSNSLVKHDCAAIVVTSEGYIQLANQQALGDLGVSIGKTLKNCGIIFPSEQGKSAFHAIPDPNSLEPYRIIQANMTAAENFVTAAVSTIMGPKDADALFLILFIKPPDTVQATKFLSQKFQLTTSEADITTAFLDGIPLRAIAAQRKRSYATIRNQFQSVLDKSGCTSQTGLLRLSFSLLQLSDQMKNANTSMQTTRTRIVSLPRPKGRVVEIAICGDDGGQPILSLPSLFGHGFTAEIEQQLKQRGVFVISVMRPGFGGTSPTPKGETLFDCTAGDVTAILNSLEIDVCAIIARASAARPFYNLLSRLPKRFSHGVIVNGLIPRNYIEGKSVASKWTAALMSFSILSYPITRLILGTGNRLLMRSEGGEFLQKMYRGSVSDRDVLSDLNVVASIHNGVKNITEQGLNSGVEEIVNGFQDWADELNDLEVAVTVFHGVDDPNVPILGVKEFAEDHAENLTLMVEENGGGQLCYSHFLTVLDFALEQGTGSKSAELP